MPKFTTNLITTKTFSWDKSTNVSPRESTLFALDLCKTALDTPEMNYQKVVVLSNKEILQTIAALEYMVDMHDGMDERKLYNDVRQRLQYAIAC